MSFAEKVSFQGVSRNVRIPVALREMRVDSNVFPLSGVGESTCGGGGSPTVGPCEGRYWDLRGGRRRKGQRFF